MVRCITKLVLLAVVLPSPLLAADDWIGSKLDECRRVTDSLRSLVCYDSIEYETAAESETGPAASNGSPPSPKVVTSGAAKPQAPLAPIATQPVAPAPVVVAPAQRPASSPLTPSSLPEQEAERAPVSSAPEQNSQSEQAAQEIRSTIVQIQKRPRGQLVMRLENGQVWSQQSSEKMRVRVGDQVQISRGLFGGFRLSSGSDKGIRVKQRR